MTITLTLSDAVMTAHETEVIGHSPEPLYAMLAPLCNRAQEHVILITMDARSRVIGVHTITIGTVNASLIHPREIYRQTILDNAVSIIIAHNHPSGDTTPSAADSDVTSKLYKAGEVIGISLLDHLIIGSKDNCSLYHTHQYLFR